MSEGDTTAAAGVLVAGHVCLDVIPELFDAAPLQPGRLATAGPARISTGGAVANVGLALRRLGTPVAVRGKVGRDLFGGAILDVLAAVDPRLAEGMLVVPGETTSYSIVVNPPGVDRAFLHCAGANDTFGAADVPEAALAAARILHVGYPPLMSRMRAADGAELEQLLRRAHAAGAATSLDMCDVDPHSRAARVDWPALLANTLPHVDLFAPSLDELRFMLGLPHGAISHALLRDVTGRVLDLGAAAAAIKLGAQGLYLRTAGGGPIARACAALGLDEAAWREREVLAPCFVPRRLTGTTGSGDATIAGLLAALLRREDPVAAASAATAVGACSVEAADATSGIPPWSEIAARLGGAERAPVAAELTAGLSWQRSPHGTLFDPKEDA